MTSHFDNAFALQSTAFQQKLTMLPVFDSPNVNFLKNSENVDSFPLQYAGSQDNIKTEDDPTEVNHVGMSLPILWSSIHQSVTNRAFSHDCLPMSNHILPTQVLQLQEGYQISHESQNSVDSTLSMSPTPVTLVPPSKSSSRKIVKPRVATVYWEDEDTTCYQVSAHNVVVSRRENDNYVNGTKLLNVTGMTRGKRDGMLKIEKGRLVVRNGPMNLKGVWIPFNRAVELARNEGVDELLYPLLVDNIRGFFQYHGRKIRQDRMDSEEEGERSGRKRHALCMSSRGSQRSQRYHGTRMSC